MPSDKPLKILVVGCGSIGRRHIRLLREMGVEVGGVDPDQNSQEIVWSHTGYDVQLWRSLESALTKAWEGAVIATPNHLHADPTIECITRQIPVLIEKPITHTVAEANRVLWINAGGECGDGPDTPVLVGYSLRFHPGLRRLKELLDSGAIGTVRHASINFGSYLPDWRPGFDYRQGYAAKRETGGGILLDASHELDYACWLFGRPVSVVAQVQNSGALEIETEDVADLVLRFESGMQANIHLDYLSRIYRRGCVITGDAGTVTWEFPMDRPVNYLTEMSRIEQDVEHAFRYPQPTAPDDMYKAELRHFLACVRGEEQPLVTGEDGIRALRLVEAAKRSSTEGKVVRL